MHDFVKVVQSYASALLNNGKISPSDLPFSKNRILCLFHKYILYDLLHHRNLMVSDDGSF